MRIEVREYSPAFSREWDDFVLCHPYGSPFHMLAWRNLIERTFRYRPLYRAAFSGDRLVGILPLFLVNGLMTGKALISSPFAVYGGALTEGSEAHEALREHAAALGAELQVEYIEMRNAYPEQCFGWAPIRRYVTFTRDLSPHDPEELLKSIPKKTRNMVRKALKTQFQMRRVRDWRQFERLHSLTLRRLGTPSFPQQYFAELVEQFGNMLDILEVSLDGVTVAASMSFLFNNQMHIYYAATDPRYTALAPNYRMYFEHLLWAGQRGCGIFDFGRSKINTGTFEFKRHWDASMRELPYEILLVRRKELPNLSPANPTFDLAIRIWQRLPLPVTRTLGPRLIRLFP
jgi:FemAB-related protein (PEP-CTERM system-associated)